MKACYRARMAGPYDLLSPEARADPYPLYHRLRAEEPVHFAPSLQMWLLTRYADVAQAVRAPELSSRRATSFVEQLPEGERAAARPFARSLGQWMLFQDPPDHTRLRNLVARAFTPK